MGIAAWVDGALCWGLGAPVTAGCSVLILEFLAAFVAMFVARRLFGPQRRLLVIGDSKYVIDCMNLLAPLRSAEAV